MHHGKRAERKRRRRRSAIEPKVGNLESDHRMRRCFLRSPEGDAINIALTAAAPSFRKLLGRLCRALREWLWRWSNLAEPARDVTRVCVGHAA